MNKITIGILSVVFALAISVHASLTPTDLRCDYAVNPLGVDPQPPRLFWKSESKERGQKQTAYQILVASSEKNLAHGNGAEAIAHVMEGHDLAPSEAAAVMDEIMNGQATPRRSAVF